MQDKNGAKLTNLHNLQFIAKKLGALRDEVVFLGGCTTALFINEVNTPDIRYTLDVDCIVNLISLKEYHHFEKQMQKHGFKQRLNENIICRWYCDNVIVDVMPTDEKILGFGNRWYKEASNNASIYPLTNKINIRVITAPYFVATKLEAFKTRGNFDFYASHDFEDIVSVLDGRIEIVDEIKNSNKNLKNYLIESFIDIYRRPAFHGAIIGHFAHYGSLAAERVTLLEQKIEAIIKT
jgi:hypothetical protein